MTGHDYMNISPYGLVVFITSHKNDVIVNEICDYAMIVGHFQSPEFNFKT
jgi:hypothetical protein